MPYFAYIVGGWVQKEGKFCLRNKSMAPYIILSGWNITVTDHGRMDRQTWNLK